MIIPAVFAFSGGDESALGKGPGLMFVTLPRVFADMELGGLIGTLFFLLVLFAALTSAISLTETLVSIVHDGLKCSRKKALGIVVVFLLVAGSFINAGYNGLSFIEPLGPGSSMLDFADFISNSVMMPIVALLIGSIVKRLRHPARTSQKRLGEMVSTLDESLSGIKVIKSYTP